MGQHHIARSINSKPSTLCEMIIVAVVQIMLRVQIYGNLVKT